MLGVDDGHRELTAVADAADTAVADDTGDVLTDDDADMPAVAADTSLMPVSAFSTAKGNWKPVRICEDVVGVIGGFS